MPMPRARSLFLEEGGLGVDVDVLVEVDMVEVDVEVKSVEEVVGVVERVEVERVVLGGMSVGRIRARGGEKGDELGLCKGG